jgi:hypothetical protein
MHLGVLNGRTTAYKRAAEIHRTNLGDACAPSLLTSCLPLSDKGGFRDELGNKARYQ